MYWFDVFGEGIKKNTFTYFEPTAEQGAPSEWTLAIHRNNVRTNRRELFWNQLYFHGSVA